MTQKTRTEKDSMGSLEVPQNALYGAQTQRAINNFPMSHTPMPALFIKALGLIKFACSESNLELGLLSPQKAEAIQTAASELIEGKHLAHFPIDVFQTGSGTSTNMNANEVIAHLAQQKSGMAIHPNDDVNMSQSSNDVIPTAIHLAAAIALEEQLLPALQTLVNTLAAKEAAVKGIVKTGRTHLMDATPIRLDQEISAWRQLIQDNIERLRETQKRLHRLPQGGTAVGTGINADPQFGRLVCANLSTITAIDFDPMPNLFVGLSSQDTAVELSGQLNVLATSLMKIANDLRWMNSGPLAGLAEIQLPALQPGSSIMPGKVNPVIPEAVCMVAAQIMGNHTAITIGGQSGNFQLNVMLPMIALNLLQSLEIAGNASQVLAEKAIAGFQVNQNKIEETLATNPILVTALNRIVGYEMGAAIAKKAYESGQPVLEVAKQMTNLDETTLKKHLNPALLTEGGNP
ncbi:MAG: aspartate ammonia-lyase [Piscirickettsiaceae bacterium CG_4_9_14_3_um_filter_43_564]|nr:class II fumarate hydratase [Thiomicrospira sp.]OIP94737.1 MAG: aspartate ammonia-lyase [Thiomicrospira sp. CG2_30_44_34]PIQ03187.1 MAG: aspartate ammonia-lyase [Piscirickettsiaceae bacterium CG18_big_fil_WC_8_21_14_2_50_44_103]PIU39462.1 MAG: aspartate ammonia-lyase [Piscirickettsiaceae bacterium CG07_land_8_20_14_0_80_44_28]PIW58549.1 MAG: aspartate ammonia-lyase [Piscirickettsiaceae bacterium CG12_big_fil_rev_8_21_14_0_65_44_934]PIW78408.1 MAG: aspartate ammonia-lyase [Piscirickettsiacea